MLVAFIALPVALRVAFVALLALAVARFVNWAIYNWSYTKHQLGPWSAPPEDAPFRSWQDQLPIIAWYRLRRESKEHGQGYWIRPLVVELLFPLAIAWYYHFYVTGGALPLGMAARGLVPNSDLHWQFLAHFVLFTLMTIATFIDFDEQSIPDYVTVTGTVIGLFGATFAPAWLPFHPGAAGVVELDAGQPGGWPLWLGGPWGLLLGLLIVGCWGFALLDRRWITRRGIHKAPRYFFARMFRNAWLWKTVCVITAVLMLGVTLVWWQAWNRWPILLSSLLGLAFAGGVTWGVRLSATWGLGVEALGFGDVTLMAMIGTYVGWQPSLLIFFIAPLVSIVFVLLRWMLTGETATPYGPYLCAATVLLLVFWDSLWRGWAANVFTLGPFILGIVVACVALMGAMLWIWRLIKQALGLAGP